MKFYVPVHFFPGRTDLSCPPLDHHHYHAAARSVHFNRTEKDTDAEVMHGRLAALDVLMVWQVFHVMRINDAAKFLLSER